MIPTKYTIGHAVYLGSTDVDGFPTGDNYADVVNRRASAIYPLASQLNMTGDYDRRVITSKVVTVPDVTPYSPRDKVILPGSGPVEERTYFVSEDVRDYNTGPFPYKPGGEIILETVVG